MTSVIDPNARDRLRDSFERLTELPMLALSLAMIPLLVAPLVLDLSEPAESTVLAVDWAIWAVFGIELAVRTYLAPARIDYLRRHWYDVLIVGLPFLRPLRVVRSARVLRLLQVARLGSFAARARESALILIRREGLKYVLLSGAAAFVACALLVLLLERGSESNIDDLGDALWWAVATATTVGYGDRFPVTTEGRAIAVVLMVVGISIFSLITANIAAFLVRDDRPHESGPTLAEVMQRLDRLEALLRARAAPDRLPRAADVDAASSEHGQAGPPA